MSDLETGLRALISAIVRDEVRRALEDAVRPDEFLTTSVAAKSAHVAMSTIRRWVRQGKLTGHGNGRTLRISRAELESFLKGSRARNDDLTPAQWVERLIG